MSAELFQVPEPGAFLLRFRGDSITFVLENRTGRKGKAWLRTNIGNARVHFREVVDHVEKGLPPLSRDWRDFPMKPAGKGRFEVTLPLLEVGRFEAKACFVPEGEEKTLWPEGGNTVVKVEPAETCAGNTLYNAFVRQFGEAKRRGVIAVEDRPCIERLDAKAYTVIPRSGKFRDLIRELDFIVGTLRCRLIQLLPIHPTPTTYARMGRFGSPFAALDFFDVDPALAEFDKRTTPLEQFGELVDEVHRRGARLLLDIPVNHTGWASRLQIEHPEWFRHKPDGSFESPGAWGVIWADLAELDYSHRGLWQYMAEVFLFWCRQGVDGFRCDAGYKVPFEVWEYIVARVRLEYPDTIFLLEGLGGPKEVTERLLADAGMNWAYSEIFQNYDRPQVEGYLPEDIRVNESKGNLVHFSETHDNLRLAATSRRFARLRVAFCALSSHYGSHAFANGVEWYATERIDVHEAHGLNWGAEPNMVDFLRRVHAIMEVHPSFHAGGTVRLVTAGEGNVAALLRSDARGRHRLLVAVNFDCEQPATVEWNADFPGIGFDLLAGESVEPKGRSLRLEPGQVVCLTDEEKWLAKVEEVLNTPFFEVSACREQTVRAKAREIGALFDKWDRVDERRFLREPGRVCEELAGGVPIVTRWRWPRDRRRTVVLPQGNLLLVESDWPFIAELRDGEGRTLRHEKSLRGEDRHFALFPPVEGEAPPRLKLHLTVFDPDVILRSVSDVLPTPPISACCARACVEAGELTERDYYAIAANRRGALAQVRLAWGELRSKYDAFLSANLDDRVPVDRHTFFTRCRAWVVHRGYSNELSLHCQKRFGVGEEGAVEWTFTVPVGEGRFIPLAVRLRLHEEENAVRLDFHRLPNSSDAEHLPDDLPVTLILRPDIEDRSHHEETKAFTGPETAWPKAVRSEDDGFLFVPAADRRLRLRLPGGAFHAEPEWTYMVEYPVDRERGMEGHGDLFSPGWFEVDLRGGESAVLHAFAGDADAPPADGWPAETVSCRERPVEEALRFALDRFIVRRDDSLTVIAGYPWFLDWGRDTLICLRGIIAAGKHDEARDIIRQFARFERGGTIPNMIRGEDDSNRDTSDAPLWLFVACRDWIRAAGSAEILDDDCGGRPLRAVLESIARGYLKGTENGIVVDEETELVFSPSHFTWMDTNFPACTPREGYPVEIQALWFHALDFLAEIDPDGPWAGKARRVRENLEDLFIIETREGRWLADCLAAGPGVSAREAEPDDALRPNQLLAVTLGAIEDPLLAREITAACEELLVPGAIRSLADRPVQRPAPIYLDGKLLNDPRRPYWGKYTGDENTCRKPAYHNGTAWTWLFPSWVEALLHVYGEPARPVTERLLASSVELLNTGCLGQIPEILDGDAPHTQRGCGAQAWGVSELLRLLLHVERRKSLS